MRKAYTRTAVVGAGIVTVASVGVAFAAWSVSGVSANSDNGKGRQVTALTVSSTLPQDIYPTDSFSQSLSVGNPNPFNASLSTVSVHDVSSSTAACQTALTALSSTAAAGLVTVANNFGTGVTAIAIPKHTGAPIAANDGAATYPTTVTVSNDLPNECQGANLTVNFTVGGSSV